MTRTEINFAIADVQETLAIWADRTPTAYIWQLRNELANLKELKRRAA